MQAFPADPTAYQLRGAPGFWAGNWRGPTFGQDSGDVRDAARRTPAGLRVGGCAWADGPRGKVLTFDGDGSVVTAATLPSVAGAGPFTITFRATATSAGSASPLSNDVVGDTLETGFLNLSGSFWFRTWVGGGQVTASGGTWATGVEYHVAGVYDGAAVRVYADGVQQAATAASGAVGANAQVFVIGRRGALSPAYSWTGTVSDVRVFGYALAPAEIAREAADPGRWFRPDWARAALATASAPAAAPAPAAFCNATNYARTPRGRRR